MVTGLLAWKTSSKQMRLLEVLSVYTVLVAVRISQVCASFAPQWHLPLTMLPRGYSVNGGREGHQQRIVLGICFRVLK